MGLYLTNLTLILTLIVRQNSPSCNTERPLLTYRISPALLIPATRKWTLHFAYLTKGWVTRDWEISGFITPRRKSQRVIIRKPPFVPLTLSEPIDLAWGHIWQISDPWPWLWLWEKIHRRASLIDLYPHNNSHQDQTKKSGRIWSPVS